MTWFRPPVPVRAFVARTFVVAMTLRLTPPVVIASLFFAAACRQGQRCSTCGMKIDPASPWVGYLTLRGREEAFDTPSCAFSAQRKAGGGEGRLQGRFREYYSQQLKEIEELRFVRGSDVVGPMGPDWVPVNAATAGRFARDHNGAPPQAAEDVVKGEP